MIPTRRTHLGRLAGLALAPRGLIGRSGRAGWLVPSLLLLPGVAEAQPVNASPPGGARAAEPAGWTPLDLSFGGYLGQGGPASRIAQASYRFVPDGRRYRLDFEVRSGLGQLRFESEGAIDAQGLQPERYLEFRQLPFKRPSTRERRFVRGGTPPTADALAVPVGTQDRLSLIAQVSWLARTRPRSLGQGMHLSVPLAAWDRVDPIELEVQAAQTVQLDGGGAVQARRFLRRNDPDQKGALEFWLAEDGGRLPSQISFVDAPLQLRFVRAVAG